MDNKYPATLNNRRQWASLWAMVRQPWDRAEDLAQLIGVGRTALAQWCHDGDRADGDERPGPWAAFVAAVRETARRHPDAVPTLAEGLIGSLLDVRGRWVPAREGAGSGSVVAELLDVHGALARAHVAVQALADGATREERESAMESLRAVREQIDELEAAVRGAPMTLGSRVVS